MDTSNKAIISIKSAIPMLKEWQMADAVDFELGRGEHIAIVGPNGSGKSMLVDIIYGKHPIRFGTIEYAFPSLTRKYVCDNVKYLAFQDCYGGETDKNYYLQQRWNQWDVQDERVLMSSGELRKYSMSKVLNQTPSVLILDNPYVGLDVASRGVLNEKLHDIVSAGNTHLILVLSRTDEVPDFITHVVPVRDLKVFPKISLKEWQGSQVVKTEDTLSPAGARPVASDAPEIVKLEKVSIRYGQRTILKDLDWTVRKGERWALMGPNGSGKSTLLSLVCADNPQSYACNISLFGKKRGSGESIWDIKKHIGYVSPELHRSFKKNIDAIIIVANGLRDYHGMFTTPNEEELSRAEQCMKTFGISDLAHRKFLSLSSGEQRLVLLARAFVKNPDLLILDEPLHGLDNENRVMVKAIIEDFCSDPEKTLVMVTHYKDELPPCINRSLSLEVIR